MNSDNHMGPDKYQQAWQAHSSRTRVMIDADLLLEEVQRSQRNFRAMIFWRDFREVGIALLMLPLWLYLGVTFSSPWTWYLTVPALIWMVGFILVDRKRHPQQQSEPGEPLLKSVEDSLTQVEHQIWLLRNVFWWYLLPLGISLLTHLAHAIWLNSEDWFLALGHAGVFVFVLVLYYFVYFLNQRAVRSQLEPRRQELLRLLESLGEETTSEGEDNHIALPALPFSEERLSAPCASPARVAISMFGIVVIMLFLVVMLKTLINTDPYLLTGEGYPKRSPFAAVRWRESQPEVQLDEEWFKLVSLDELPAAEIVSFSQRTYGSKWRKRFEEDLVELLTRMGHPPRDKVTLVVQSLASSETQVRKDVPMTYANRQTIKAAAQKREALES